MIKASKANRMTKRRLKKNNKRKYKHVEDQIKTAIYFGENHCNLLTEYSVPEIKEWLTNNGYIIDNVNPVWSTVRW